MEAAFEQVTGVAHPIVSHTGYYPANLMLAVNSLGTARQQQAPGFVQAV